MKNYFKLITIILLIFVAQKHINAQIPKPYWAKNALQAPDSGKYIFVYGEGNGNTQESSINKAFANAVVKGQYELGSVTISAQDIATIEKEGLDAAMRFTNRQIKITCQTDPVIVEERQHDIQYKTFILIQMSLYADKSARFYDLPNDWDCIDNNYYNEMTQYNERMNKLKKEKDKKERRKNDDFIQSGYNQNISLSIGNGVSYSGGNIIGLAFSGRLGGLSGIEPHISFGVSRKKFDAVVGLTGNHYTFSKTKLVYSIGINVFILKGLYVDANYGVNDLYVVDHYYDDYEKRYADYLQSGYASGYPTITYEEYVSRYIYGHTGSLSSFDGDDEKKERFELNSYNGMSFIVGYKYYFGNKYIDLGAGVKCHSEKKPSFGFEKLTFAWNVGFGISIR